MDALERLIKSLTRGAEPIPQNNDIIAPVPDQDVMRKGGYYKRSVPTEQGGFLNPLFRFLGATDDQISRTPFDQEDVLGQQDERVTPTPTPDNLEESIRRGLESYGDVPVATASSALAEAGRQLPHPNLPAILSLIETAGGNKINRGQNNLFNILPTRAGVNYPDYNTAITGGNGQQGLLGLLTKSGLYDDYLESGKLSDFFNTYSPATENAPVQQQVDRYNSIRDQYFR